MKKILFVLCLSLHAYADWAETTLSSMSTDEKIGQLLIAPVCELREAEHRHEVIALLKSHHLGGVIFKQGTVAGQAQLYHELQAHAQIPLLGVQDAETNLSKRLTDAPVFPSAMTLGAIQDQSLIYELGKELGAACKHVGGYLNLAPVVDVNSNPLNPIIGIRSFGDDVSEVASRGIALMQGLQESGILACAKHFPGHGDTFVDSHCDLPLAAGELEPFRQMIDAGVSVVMTAHLFVPTLDAEHPVTFSSKVVQGVLREELEFKGLIISDALNMQALARYYSSAEIAVRAFLAGHDLLLYGDHIAPNVDRILHADVPEAFKALKQAVAEGVISEELLNERVLKILQAKQRLHLDEQVTEYTCNQGLKERLYEEAVTLVRDEQGWLGKEAEIVSVYDVTEDIQSRLRELREGERPFVVVVYGSPYSLPNFSLAPCVLMAYENTPEAQAAVTKILTGKLIPKGKLPIR